MGKQHQDRGRACTESAPSGACGCRSMLSAGAWLSSASGWGSRR